MRKSVVFLCLSYLLQVNAFAKFDLKRSLDTVTDELLRAQNELSITHEFSELQTYINRNIVTSYIEMMNEVLIESFMNTHREMITIENSVRDVLDGKPQNDCVNRVRLRFDLQVQRHGNFLSRCMQTSRNELQEWIDHTNQLHDRAQLTLNQAQNQGLAAISERNRIDSADSFYTPVNRRLRILLTSVRSYMDEFEEFRASLVDNEDDIIDALTACDRDLVIQFRQAADLELALAGSC